MALHITSYLDLVKILNRTCLFLDKKMQLKEKINRTSMTDTSLKLYRNINNITIARMSGAIELSL